VTNLLNSLQIKFEIILVIGPEVNRYELKELVKNFPEIIIVTNELLFNFSRRVNDGLAIAKHDLIWLLNDDIRIINHNSVKEDLLIAYCLAKKSTTGIVGTFLMEGNLINHAGMQINDEIADHILRGSQFSNLEAMNAFRVREVSGVTGANIFFLKKTIEELGNFDETFPLEFSDVELCLRANKNGLQNYVIRTKNFNHFESSTRDNSLDPRHQILRALTKYEIEYKEDPYKFTVPYCCLKEMSETNQ
jgi:GT2 family glycosyltransferase